MRCDTVQRELSAPNGLDQLALSDHLSDCPSCASWATKVENLDKIWQATRPLEPSSDVFNAMWSQVVAQADAPRVLTFAPRFDGKRWGLKLAACAQAAAILIGALVLLSSRPTPVGASVASVTAEEGKTLFVTLRDGRAPTVVASPQLSESETDTVSIDFDILGYMESIR